MKRRFINHPHVINQPHDLCQADAPHQRGAVMLLFASLVVVMFLLAGLALDSGNLFHHRLAAQASADAAVIAGASMLALTGADNPIDLDAAITGAREIATRNMNIKGVSGANLPVPDVAFNAGSQTLSVTVSAQVPLYFMSILPESAGFRTVATTAQSTIRRASIELILDTSESMACPDSPGVGSGPCDCIGSCVAGPGSRMAALKDAVNNFLNFFDETRDSIGVTVFGTGAETIVPMAASGFSRAAIEGEINALTTAGATNVSDAFFRAYWDARAQNRERQTAYIYFADGAPSAGRFFFRNTRSFPSVSATSFFNNQILNQPWSYADYISWSVTLRRVLNPGTPIETVVQEPAPQSSIKTPLDPVQIRELRTLTTGGVPAWAARFGTPSFEDYEDPFETFLLTPEVLLPPPEPSFRHLVDGRNLYSSALSFRWNDFDRQDHMRMYYDQALIMAEMIRNIGGTWYTIGYGRSADRGTEAYQQVEDMSTKKDYFLTRLTADICGVVDNHPIFPEIIPLIELLRGGVRPGSYYPISDDMSIREVFENVARKVRVRMVR